KEFSYRYINGKHMSVNTSPESVIKAIEEFVYSNENI
ncbi:thioesterase, partial [Streptococcus equi]|nr:thioesterase [Streptococcus equi]